MYKTIIFFVLMFGVKSLSAQQKTDFTKGFFSAGINPTYPFLGGYGAKVFYNFPKTWSIGLASEGSFQLPKFASKQFFKNGETIKVNWDYAIGLEARYRFRKKDNDIKGFYLLSTIGYEGWIITKAENAPIVPNKNLQEKFTTWYSSLGGGYNLFPFKNRGFWVGIQYNVIFILNNTNDRNVNGNVYNIKPIVPPALRPNLYIGWRF
jgi:hypothetical protein